MSAEKCILDRFIRRIVSVIINVRRPIKTIRRHPLTVAYSSTVRDEDLVPIPLIDPDRNGEVLGVRYNERQRFYYKSGLTPEEVVFDKVL
ncbi:hypothetical protein ACRE_045690 [Hapsidospora chrysogenum ATCC 11550]|uniref:Uncharacterized protein n=1 Tax=Hapsidospora chrysogenum (strain ATCC 11550 / CBS 779.69 / DSM 880 / IAM 14645 / JCM 23072 / IMI 49137) TaxID=857340 RepID=A0A086T5J7_HAPC1|nr:hypothetical protein ACRE_045690 [Hapsidospora chrysogenum ATCC 11550]